MKRTLFAASFLGFAMFLMTGCSEAPAPEKKVEVKKPAEPVTGQSAIYQTYQLARTWAPDAMLLKLENGNIPEAPPQPGKYGFWRATYVSQTKRLKREYTYAADDSEGGIIKGARAGSEVGYVGVPTVRPFAIQEVKIDTPAALETAAKIVDKDKDMRKVLAENQDLPVQYQLEWPGTTFKPMWRVIYGRTVSQSKFSVFIDAYTGDFVRKR